MISSNLKENNDDRVKDYQLYLDDPSKNDLMKLANKISPNNKFVEDQKNLGIKITKEKLKEQYNISFTQEEIYAECRRYNLAFISSRDFKGEYTIKFLEKLKAFFDKTKIMVSNYDYTTQLYILAPQKADCENISMKYPCKNPLLFCKIDNMYVLIDGSKSYISLFNYWQGFKHLKERYCRYAYMIEHASLFYILLFAINYLFKLNISANGYFILGFPIILLSFISQLIRMGKKNSHIDDFGGNTKHDNRFFNNYKYKL